LPAGPQKLAAGMRVILGPVGAGIKEKVDDSQQNRSSYQQSTIVRARISRRRARIFPLDPGLHHDGK
jgi:hypothetical protein